MRSTSGLGLAGKSLGVVALLLTVTGCRGWGRVQAGGAYNLPDRPRQSGQVYSVDGAFGVPKFVSSKPLPIGVHTSAEALVAPERKSFGWGTGLVLYGVPRPIGPYVLAGTLLHVDQIRDRFSFGGVSPYGEVGLLASVPSRQEEEGSGLLLSLALSGATYFNYLVGGNETVDGFVFVKLGVGWEKH